MSRFQKHQAKSALQQLVGQFKKTISERGTEFASSQTTNGIISLESLGMAEMNELNNSYQEMEATLNSIYEQVADTGGRSSLSFESMTPTQREAGVITAMAAGNPVEYARKAYGSRPSAGTGVVVVSAESSGSAGNLDYRDEASLEAFDERALKDFLPYSVVFNVQASRQDEFSEAFYPTTIVSPEVGGIDITVDRITVHNAVKHRLSGRPADFGMRNLMEAVADHTILADESTDLVPFVAADNSNLSAFVDSAVVAPFVRRIAGVDVRTAPLKAGEEHDLLGLSQHPELVGAGVIDHTDAVDTRVYLKKIYLRIGDAGSVLEFDVSRLPRNSFMKSIEGQSREVSLNFMSQALQLTENTKAVDGSMPAELNAVRDNDYNVRVAMTITGSGNLMTGNFMVAGSGVRVLEILNADGNPISITQGQGQSIANGLRNMTLMGYTLGAARTNSNRRTRGLLINNLPETERYTIPLGAPISAPSPVGSDRDAKDLDSLITAARIRNSNNAVTTLLNYQDTLRAFVKNRRIGQGNVQIEGMGRHMVVPFFEEHDLDMSGAVNSLSSGERGNDIASAITNFIKDVAYRMYRNSAYQAALNCASTGGTQAKPTLVVGCDAIILRHMMTMGDNRTFGIGFEDPKIVSSFDARMDGKIVMTFVRPGMEGQPDALSFGTFAWIPELVSSIQVSRDGATYTEAMVQPRSRHINNLPIMAVINVTNLTDVFTKNIPVKTEDTGKGTGTGTPQNDNAGSGSTASGSTGG